jgi:hypothetical protein
MPAVREPFRIAVLRVISRLRARPFQHSNPNLTIAQTAVARLRSNFPVFA